MVCVPWGRISYPGFKEMSIINTQLPNFRFHNMRKVRINYSNVSVCSWKMVARAFPRKCEQDWTTFPPQGKASQHHVGYEVHTLLTVFMEVEDSWPLSSLTKSFNIPSENRVMSSLLVVKHLQRSITLFIRGLTRTTAAEFCCPPKMSKTNAGWISSWRNCGATLSPTNTLFHKTRDQSKSRSTNSESSLGRLKNM